MRLRSTLALFFAITSAPAFAQTSQDTTSPNEIALQVARGCDVQPTFVSVERGIDKVLRYQVSPTLSEVQLNCIRSALGNLGVFDQKK